MIRNLLLLFIVLFSLSCTETEEPITKDPDPIEEPAPKPISVEIKQLHSPVALGQRIDVHTTLGESLTGTRYKWLVKYDGKTIAEEESEHTALAMHVEEGIGDYIFNLEVTNGERKGTASHTVEVYAPDFEYGMWGNSRGVIEAAEEINGNEPRQGMIGMPVPYDGAHNDREVYQRSSTRNIAYYFEDNKLKGGAEFKSGSSQDSKGDFIWYQGYYKLDQHKLNEKFGTEGSETINWNDNVTLDAINHYLNQSNNQGVSMAVDNGHATVTTVWEVNGQSAKLELTRAYQQGSAISYTVYKK